MPSIFGLQLPKVKNPYDINNVGDYGINKFNPGKTQQRLDEIYTTDITRGMNDAREAAAAGGSFNTEGSAYHATQAARDSRNRASVDLDKYSYESQFKELDALLGISSDKRQNELLKLQAEMYEDSKPTWLTDVFSIAGSVVPFLDEGGVIGKAKFKKVMTEFENGTLKDSSGNTVSDIDQALSIAYSASGMKAGGGVIKDTDYYLKNTGGTIPFSAINSTEEITGDNTLIKAKPEESINNIPATKLIGDENVEFLNNAAMQLIGDNNMFGNQVKQSMPSGVVSPVAGQMPGGNMSQAANPMEVNIGGGILEKLKNLFAASPQAVNGSPKMMQEGGNVGGGDDELETLMSNFMRLNQEAGSYARGESPEAQQYGVRPEKVEMYNRQVLEALGNLKNYKINKGMQAQPGQQPGGQKPATDKTRKITIEEKPIPGIAPVQ